MINKEEEMSIISNLIENMEFHISHVMNQIENPNTEEDLSGKEPVDLNAELHNYVSKKSYLEGLLVTLQANE